MKRRNAECGKLRRPLKRNKITEGIYGSTLLYLKFLLLWVLVLLADFVLEFRFEYLWPFWLLLRSVYDSFKYQGLAFSVFFVCIALTSDMICFFYIPVQWLFFAASTYVWVQYVWHTEKGICLSTMVLWLLFVYIEAAVRLRDLRHLPFHLDLCRPFAAHCIGYPVVTLGFGFKSYIGYRIRQRKQKDVAKENEFYMQLLQQALPQETQPAPLTAQPCTNPTPEKSKGGTVVSNDISTPHCNGVIQNGSAVGPGTAKQSSGGHRKSLDKGDRESGESGGGGTHRASRYSHTNGSIHCDVELVDKNGSVNDLEETESEQHDKNFKTQVSTLKTSVPTNNKWSSGSQRRGKCSNRDTSNIDDYCLRLETDVKRLKADLQTSRQLEQDLRGQISVLSSTEKSMRNEIHQLQQDNDNLQNKLHGLITGRQSDRQGLASLERRLQDERRARSVCESQLAAERKAKRAEEAATARAVAMATAAANKPECSESCRTRRRELEAEVKQLRRDLKAKEDRLSAVEREAQLLRQYKENLGETEILMSALSAMQDKNAHLETSLSAETRIKLDLFSALGEAKRQLEIRENLIRAQDREIEELKSKIAQVLAVMPSDSFTPASLELSHGTTGVVYTSKLLLAEDPTPTSNLDPNATAYTPKGTMVASTEA